MKMTKTKQLLRTLLCALTAILLCAGIALTLPKMRADAKNAVVGTAADITLGYESAKDPTNGLFIPLPQNETVLPGTFNDDRDVYYTKGYDGINLPVNQSDCIVFGGETTAWSDFVLTFDVSTKLHGAYSVFRLYFRVWDNRDWMGDYVDFAITDDQTIETISFGTVSRESVEAGKVLTTYASVSSTEGFINNKGLQTIKLAVKGPNASLYIDGENILNTSLLDTTHIGHFEFEFWDIGAELHFPIEISTQVGADDLVYDVLSNSTKIANPAPVYTEITSVKTWNAVQLSSPSAAIVRFNDEGKLVNEEGTKIGSRGFSEVYKALNDGGIISCFYISSDVQAGLLNAEFSKMSRDNVMVFSADGTVLKTVKTVFPDVLCVLDASGAEADISAIRGAANASGARVVMLSQKQAEKSFVNGLQAVGIAVVAKADEANNKTDIYSVILSGANGVVGDSSTIMTAYDEFEQTTLVRSPDLIAFRGASSTPNSLESITAAANNGYDGVEADIFLTQDGKLVVTGSKSLGEFAEGSGNIEDMTLEEVTAKHILSNGEPTASTIPSLEQVFEALKDKDIVLYLQINASSYTTYESDTIYLNTLKTELKSLIGKYGMENKIVLLTFYQSFATKLMTDADFAKYTLGLAFSAEADVLKRGDYSAVSESINGYNAIMDIEYASLSGQIHLLYQMARRGVLVNAFGYHSAVAEALLADYLTGYDTLAVEYKPTLLSCLKDVSTNKSAYYLNGATADIALAVTDYAGNELDLTATGYKVLSGTVTLERTDEGYRATSLGDGDAYVLFYSDYNLGGQTYRVYTQPVKIGAKAPAEEGPGGNGGGNNSDKLPLGAIIGIVVGCVALVGVVVLVVVLVLKKKKANKPSGDEQSEETKDEENKD